MREDRRRFLRFLASSPLVVAQGKTIPGVIDKPAEALNVMDIEGAAGKALPPAHFGYLETGVDDDKT